MFPWWDSLNFVSAASTVASWAVVIFGLLALVCSQRESALKDREGLKRDTELATLKEKQRPRSISAEQKRLMIASLEGASRCPLSIWFDSTNPETHDLAVQIHAVLEEAGYNAAAPNGIMQLGATPMERGVFVSTQAEAMAQYGRPIARALAAAGIAASERVVPKQNDQYSLSIEIGPKP